ncbi:MAG: hypothetical protein V3V67_12750 [Myxococcota bacterium]
MKVVSGAGEFELTAERVDVREGALVLVGKMGIWESETFIDPADIGLLARLSLRPRVLLWLAARPFAALWSRLGRRSGVRRAKGDT